MNSILLGAVLGAMLVSPLEAGTHPDSRQGATPPRILLDQPLRAVEYQLNRLSNEELTRVERKTDDVRYRPVYYALLTRKGLAKEFRDEALAALTRMDQMSQTRVLLEALAKVPVEDALTAEKLLGLLLGQPADTLRQQRELFVKAIDGPSQPLVLRGAYAGLMIADGNPGPGWGAAVKHDGHLVELLRSVPYLPSGSADALRAQLFTPVAALAGETPDAGTRAEALAALGWTRRDASTFELLAREVLKGSDAEARAAAIRSLQLFPQAVWPASQIEPLARAIVALVGETTPDRRTEPAAVEAIQLGEKLASGLPDERGRAVRRDLRALGVQVVRIETVPEKLSFDLNWFVVEAGKPVQIVLSNPDAMSHNLVISNPGSLQEVGMAGGVMPIPTDPNVKPFVPDTPLVLYATRLLQEGETERLGFVAPKTPGEYLYICTFPGHFIRMYGVMLVVENLEMWEASPTTPIDPMTKQPFSSRRK